jgi:hypothetical protein
VSLPHCALIAPLASFQLPSMMSLFMASPAVPAGKGLRPMLDCRPRLRL